MIPVSQGCYECERALVLRLCTHSSLLESVAAGSSLPVLECSISKQILSAVSAHLSSSPWLVLGQLLQKLWRHALRAVERLEAWISLKASKSICILRPVSLCHVFPPPMILGLWEKIFICLAPLKLIFLWNYSLPPRKIWAYPQTNLQRWVGQRRKRR